MHIHLLRFSLFLAAGPPCGARRLRTDGSLRLRVRLLVEQVECKLRLGTSGCAGRPSPTNPTAGCVLIPNPSSLAEVHPKTLVLLLLQGNGARKEIYICDRYPNY